jgi:RHS repeat-associated protein
METALSHSRPAIGTDETPMQRERIVLSLPGRQTDMVRRQGEWVPRNGGLAVRMRQAGAGWVVFDGSGLTYTFTQDSKLQGTGLWLLESIKGPGAGGNLLKVTHKVGLKLMPGSPYAAVTIDVSHISYDAHPTITNCFKHEINLNYDDEVSTVTPLALTVFGDRVLTRLHKLVSIDVASRETCSAAAQRLRSYSLMYQLDQDTKQWRLNAVRMRGRHGLESVPVASYSYGSATYNGANGTTLRYQTAYSLALPPGVSVSSIASTQLDSSVTSPWGIISSFNYGTFQSLTDVTGDGRPDFVYRHNSQLFVALNQPGASGTSVILPGSATPTDNSFTHGAFESHSSTQFRWSIPGQNEAANIDQVWRQAVDVNGDGRVDIIDASQKAKHWIIYLNTPGPAPTGVTWVKRAYNIEALYQRLIQRGHPLTDGWLPLSRKVSGRNFEVLHCYRHFPDGHWEKWPDSDLALCYDDQLPDVPNTNPEQTYTEWEVRDINGDGYPDVVFNSSPIQFVSQNPDRPSPDEPLVLGGEYSKGGAEVFYLQPSRSDNAIQAVLNTRGVFISNATPTNPFSAPIELTQPTQCGLGKWVQLRGGGSGQEVQIEKCGLIDVNGDGLVDHYEDRHAYLGTGSGFYTPPIPMPGDLSQQWNPQRPTCGTGTPDPNKYFVAYQMSGLRDLTGDGIPDFVEKTFTGWQVWLGTGASFALPIPIEGEFAITEGRDNCDGSVSTTLAGLYDIDGDGKADTVVTDGPLLRINRLTGGAGVVGSPEAGRLVSVDNGYGAVTQIGYRSAKEDGSTPHQVPQPEIVVSSVTTVDTYGLGGKQAQKVYAYGGAQLFYDPARDAFLMPGYQRTVQLIQYPSSGIGTIPDLVRSGTAELTDTYPLVPFSQGMSQSERFGRYVRAGRVSDVSILAGVVSTDPWALLTANLNGDPRRIAVTHVEYDTRLFLEPPLPPPTDDLCQDIIDQYDFDKTPQGQTSSAFDVCSSHGFVYQTNIMSWRGSAVPPTMKSVSTNTVVRKVDDFGQVISVYHRNDVNRSDDDICVDTQFAVPVGADERVVSAPAQMRFWDCGPEGLDITWGAQRFEYDNLPPGSVGTGKVTSHTTDRHATDTGTFLGTIRDYDIDYDAQGNPTQIRRKQAGAQQTVTFDYDPFRLVVVSMADSGSGTVAVQSSRAVDPVSLLILSSTDANGTERGATYDGFGRTLLTTVKPKGGPVGARSSTTYAGYAGGDPLGRRVIIKSFLDPVDPTSAAVAAGRTSTVYLDELGRQRLAQIGLGADYANETLIMGARIYDSYGRVVFEAYPYLASENPNTAYGTTRFFEIDGSLRMLTRGHGPQPFTAVPDDSLERYPTLLTHTFDNYMESVSVQDAASLQSGSPQNGVVLTTLTSAIGRPLFKSTWKSGARLEHSAFAHDRLGNQVSLIRFQNAANSSNPVSWTWRFDSLGQVIQLLTPTGAPQNHSYSDWGELIEVLWTPPSPEVTHSIIIQYDALGRITHTEERNGSVVDVDTANDYFYDVPMSPTPHVNPANVLGRLSYATGPNGTVYFSYDPYGRVSARTYTDKGGTAYIEHHAFHSDGLRAIVELNLPDTGYKPERVEYGYDSAFRQRSMLFSDGETTQALFKVTNIDPFGRLLAAQFGNSTYSANYATSGRRLLKDVKVTSPMGSRSFGVNGYDVVGRELSRVDNGATTAVTYDALRQLATSVKTSGTSTLANWSFGYDPLGNVNNLQDYVGNATANISYLPTDRDQICRINYGFAFGLACNVDYDSFGNVVAQATRNGDRKLSYFNFGGVRSIIDSNGTSAQFHYDPFGVVQSLELLSNNEKRSEQHYGALITHRYHSTGVGTTDYTERLFPGPGMAVSRRGADGPWIFYFGEARGSRFTVDDKGTFIQDLEYQPFGETTSTGAQPGTAQYSSEQWNGGDSLQPLGLVHLGVRLYDPVIGRFLSRDPILNPRSAASANPYAFAANDPVNSSDPSGLCEGGECEPTSPWVPPLEGGGSGKPPKKPRHYTPAQIDKLLRGEAATEAGRAWQLMVMMHGYNEDGEFMDNVAEKCGASIKCVFEAVENSGLSEADLDYNERVEAMKPVARDMFLMGVLPGWVAFGYGMAHVSNHEQAATQILLFGLGGGPGRAAESAILGGGSATGRQVLYHYTNEVGMTGIVQSRSLRPSLWRVGTKDVRYGNGQYVSDILPGTRTPSQLSRDFLGQPFQGKRFTHYVEIDVTGLGAVQGRPGVFVIPNEVPLDLTGRLLSSGKVPVK